MGLFKRRSKDLFRLPEPPPGPGLPPGTGPPARPSRPSLPEPFSQPARPFRMPVGDVFIITGRGLVATGRIEAGIVAVSSQVTVERGGVAIRTTEVAGVEKFRKRTRSAGAGENVGLLLRGLQRGDVAPGDVLRGHLP